MSSMCPDVFSLWHSAGPIYKWITTLLVGTIARLVQPMGLRQNASATSELGGQNATFPSLSLPLTYMIGDCLPVGHESIAAELVLAKKHIWMIGRGINTISLAGFEALPHCLDIMSIQKCCGNQTFHGPSCPKPTTSSTWQKTVAELPQFRNSRREFFRCLCSC